MEGWLEASRDNPQTLLEVLAVASSEQGPAADAGGVKSWMDFLEVVF